MTPRSLGGIALRTKHDRVSYYFISLETGKSICARQGTVLNVTESVIYIVEQIAAKKGINEMVDGEMLFEWKPGDSIQFQPNYKEVIPPSNHSTNEETKGN